MADGFEQIVHRHQAASAVHRRFRDTGQDAVAREHCMLVDRYLAAEEVALLPRLRDVPGGDALATELGAQSAAVRHLVARVFEAPPSDIGPLIDTIETESRTYEELVENTVIPLMREHGVDAAALAAALDDARTSVSEGGGPRP